LKSELKAEEQTKTRWDQELAAARGAARAAAFAIRQDFGHRNIVDYKGIYDVQLHADLVAQRVIIEALSRRFADYAIVSEEGMQDTWSQGTQTWVVDPLDGTNNFGYGIAHCAVSICLFDQETPVLAVVLDPILNREFQASEFHPMQAPPPRPAAPPERATVAFVADYSVEGRVTGRKIEDVLSRRCKRVTTMWAPALDLALVASGSIDAMVCRNANLIDVCAGLFLVRSAGGCVLDTRGGRFELAKAMHRGAVSFVAARSESLARELLGAVSASGAW
jgi:myo-inositol-1(or 4)-monophosphatase